MVPALLNSTSKRPNFLTISEWTASMTVSSVTSVTLFERRSSPEACAVEFLYRSFQELLLYVTYGREDAGSNEGGGDCFAKAPGRTGDECDFL